MVIDILITIFSLVVILFLESTTLVLLNFSIVIILALSLMYKMDWRRWLITVSIFAVLLDIVTHQSLGVTLLAISISSISLHLLFSLIPKAHDLLSLLPYFASILIFYIFITLFPNLFSQGTLGYLNFNIFLTIVLKSLISTVFVYIFNTLFTKFRGSKNSLI